MRSKRGLRQRSRNRQEVTGEKTGGRDEIIPPFVVGVPPKIVVSAAKNVILIKEELPCLI
jgi:hypothetical protein